MSKKIISVLLAVLMVITAAFGTMTVSAEGLINYVGDGGFETTDFSGTILNFGTGGATQEMTWGRFSSGVTRLEIETDANGNKYLKSGVTADGNYIRGMGQILNLPAGDYILTFVAKSDAGEVFSVGVYPATSVVTDKPAIKKITLDATDYWKEYKVEFTVTADGKYNLIIGGNTAGNGNIRLFYLDDVAVYAKDSIVNITANATVGGTVTGGGVVAKGETLTLTATAKSGYTFAGWVDGETSATRTLTATADATYTANFTKNGADFVPNGDFESEDWILSDYWTTLSGNAAFTEAADPVDTANTVAYAKGANAATSMVSKNTVTLKQGHTYVMEFKSYMVSAFTGNGTNYYRVGFVKPGSTALGTSSFVAGKFEAVYNKTFSSELGTWKKFTYKYTHDAADTEANLVLGMYNQECTSDWYLDDIIAYDEADICQMTVSAENGGIVEGAKASYFKGEKVTVTATPEKEGYEFLGWFNGDVKVSDDEKYTFVASENVTLVAKYKVVVPPVYSVVNGDFEANENVAFNTNITGTATEGVWAKVGTGVNMFAVANATDSDPDFVGDSYAVATVPNEGYLRTFGQFVELKPNTDYVLEFAAKSNVLTSGDKPYAPVYGAVIKRMSGSHGIHIAGGSINVISSSSYANILADGEWHRYTVTFNSGDNTKVAVAFGGNTSVTAGMHFAVDNVVLSESKTAYISDFENGADGWAATEGATVTTADTSSTVLNSFTKYLGNKIGVLNPVNEGDVFTSPTFNTVVGERYDVVIYTRHNSADDTRGTFSFTADAEKEILSFAAYGKDDNGLFENDDGFAIKPIVTSTAKYTNSTFAKLIFSFTATADSHNISITANTPVSAFIDGFVLYAQSDAVELAENSISYKGTAIRTTGVQGLRFKNRISLDALTHSGNYAKVVEYGTLAIKAEYKNGEITVENLTDGKYEYTKSSGTVGCRLKCGVAYKAEDGTDVVFASDIYNKDFTGVLTGITEENYTSDYVTRAYAKVQFADGTYTYVYGDERVASVYAVAEYIVENELETQEIRDCLNTNILGK